MFAFHTNCRGVLHTPECTHLSMRMFSGRMRYAPTLAFASLHSINENTQKMKPTQMYVRLDGLRFYARHGVLPQETKVGAEFTVDLRLAADFSCAAEMDELEGTLNYAEVFERVKAEMEISSKLLEHVAYRIARRLLHDFPALTEVQIGVYKQRRVGVEAVYRR